MADLPFIKANVKLPRGSYFYIQVGHRFYAGEQAETVEVEVSNRTPFLGYFNKDKSMKPGFKAIQYRDNYTSWWSRGSRSARDRRKGSEAKYRQPYKRAGKTIENQLTGKKFPVLVDLVEQAKQYRKKDLAEKACERLENLYSNSGIKVTLRFQGETHVDS